MVDAGLKLKIFSKKDLLLESWYMKRAHTCTMKNLPFEGHVPSGFHCKSRSRANGADPAYKFSNFNKMPRWESRESKKLFYLLLVVWVLVGHKTHFASSPNLSQHLGSGDWHHQNVPGKDPGVASFSITLEMLGIGWFRGHSKLQGEQRLRSTTPMT